VSRAVGETRRVSSAPVPSRSRAPGGEDRYETSARGEPRVVPGARDPQTHARRSDDGDPDGTRAHAARATSGSNWASARDAPRRARDEPRVAARPEAAKSWT
jgi:hypothetical protein